MKKLFLKILLAIILLVPNVCAAETSSKPAEINLIETVVKTKYVELCYPAVGGLKSQDILNKINEDIKKEALSFVGRVEMLNTIPGEPITGWTNYVLRYADNGILSICFNEGTYLQGGTYPQMNIIGLNYDVTTGKRLEHGLKNDIETIRQLNVKLEALLRKDKTLDLNNVSILPKVPRDFFYTDKGKKVLIIQKDTVAPQSIGSIFLPLED